MTGKIMLKTESSGVVWTALTAPIVAVPVPSVTAQVVPGRANEPGHDSG
jgi:hypothetical protein